MPAEDKDSIALCLGKRFFDMRRVAAVEAVQAWHLCDVVQEDLVIAGQEVDVPLEFDSESRFCLIILGGAVCKKDFELEALGKQPKERCIILHWMRCDDRKPHQRAARSALSRSKISA